MSAPPVSASAVSPASLVPISSPHDPHVYRHITLNNGLSALLFVDKPLSAIDRARLDARKKRDAKAKLQSSPSSPGTASSQTTGEDANGEEDDESKPAVVALSVGVGHWSDPPAVPGLAHFLEHMLFMGNKSYPAENEWEEYLSEHGGASNAFTDALFTCYYFEINPSFLHPALQRFAQFFVSPLFAPSATKREIRAVDSEFRDCIHSDDERMNELLCSTAAIVKPQHPFCKFGWGNKESLETNLKPKAAPATSQGGNQKGGKQQNAAKGKNATGQKKANGGAASSSSSTSGGVDLRAELKAFHARYYSSHQMKLVVYQSGGKLDKLERWIRAEFEAIERRPDGLEDFASFGHPFQPSEEKKESKQQQSKGNTAVAAPTPQLSSCLKHMFYIVPIKEIYKLSLSWIITPSLQKFYKSKPFHYAEHLLGHESEGSLYALLRDKGWITSLTAGVNESGNHKNVAFENLQLNLTMTKEGCCSHLYDILDAVFQYLALMRSPADLVEKGRGDAIYDELKQLADIGFRFSEQQDPSDAVQDYAINLHVYPASDVIQGDFIHSDKFDRELTLSVLKRLSVDNVRIDVAAPEFKTSKANQLFKAPWFHTQYAVEAIPESLLAKWRSYDSNPQLIDPALHLPARNPFVPTDFVIKSHVQEADAKKQLENQGPTIIAKTQNGVYWWYLDDSFKLPRAHIHILLESPACYSSATTVALSELLIKLWCDSINEYAYQASLAELEYSVESLRSGIEIKLSGFNHKLLSFTEKVMQGLAELEGWLRKPQTLARFESMKEKTYRYFLHRYFVPLKQANYSRLTVLQQQRYAIEDVTAAAKNLTMDQLIQHLNDVRRNMHVVALVDGNVQKSEALDMFEKIEKHVVIPSAATQSLTRIERCITLPQGHSIHVDQRCRNHKETNHSIEAYFQIGVATLHTRSILSLLEQFISEPAFDQLRTKEQLGYKVQSGVRNTHGVLGFVICIQSAAYDPLHLSARIESFIWNTFYPMLLGMSTEKFTSQRASLVAEYLYQDTHLGERVDRNWEEISDTRSYCFSRPSLMSKLVAQVQHGQVVQMFEHFFLGINPQPPVESGNVSEILMEIDSGSVAAASASPAASPSPTPSEVEAEVAVSTITLEPAEEEARRKEERKAAKKQRKAAAAAEKSSAASAAQAKAASSNKKDPAAEAAIALKVSEAKLKPVLYRRHLNVCIFGHAHKKKAQKDSDDNDEQDEEEEDEEGSEEDGEDDEEGSDEGEEEEEEEGEEGSEAGSSDSEDDDPNGTPAVDSVWLTTSEWTVRLAEQNAREVENSAAVARQPAIKKQRNGKNKQTHTHAATPAAASNSATNTALFAAFPSPPQFNVSFLDNGLSVNCACSGSTTVSSSSATATTAVQLEHRIRIRTNEALATFKSKSEFYPDATGPEPDMPASAVRANF